MTSVHKGKRVKLRASRILTAPPTIRRTPVPVDPRPAWCCGECPPTVGGGYDCTCAGNPRCAKQLLDDLASRIEEWGRVFGGEPLAENLDLARRLGALLEGTLKEMHERELHHFETEERLSRLSVNPPDGWYTFGTHAGDSRAMEFYGKDEDGMPLWERPA